MTNRNEDMRKLLDSIKPFEVEAKREEKLNVFEAFSQWGKVNEDEDVEDEADDADADTTATADEGAEGVEDLNEADDEADDEDADAGEDEDATDDLDEAMIAQKIAEAIETLKIR